MVHIYVPSNILGIEFSSVILGVKTEIKTPTNNLGQYISKCGGKKVLWEKMYFGKILNKIK